MCNSGVDENFLNKNARPNSLYKKEAIQSGLTFFEIFYEGPESDSPKPLRKLKKKNLLYFNERRVSAMGAYGFNQEGYPDPTAIEAVANVTKAEKKYLPLVYICSKYSGDVVGNTEAAKRYSRYAVDAGAIPLAPHLLLPLYLKEETERDLAMFMDMVLLGKCDELWVFGSEASPGMSAEIAKAKKHHKKIRYFDEECRETNRALEIRPERLQEES